MQSDLEKSAGGSVTTAGGDIVIPAVIAHAGERAAKRFIEFFIATIRNGQTRKAYTGRE